MSTTASPPALIRPKAEAAPRPRVLATVVVPPHLSVSGGSRAAELLSAALAPHCSMTVASMMNGTGATLSDGGPAPARLPVQSWLPPLLPWSRLPNRYSTLFYRSSLPGIVRRTTPAGGFDLVHIHNPMPALEMARVADASRAHGLPYVVSTHGYNEVANGGTIYGFDPLRRQIWQRLVVDPVRRVTAGAAAIFALSSADIPIIRDMGFTGEVVVVPNGVPLPAKGDAAADLAMLAALGIPPRAPEGTSDPITLMFLANHTPNKGLPVLLEAFRRIEQPALLVIGGETRPGIDYEGAIAACRSGQRIIVTGRLRDADIGALFRRSDVFVFPTLADTFPLAVLEGMAQGLPILASRIGGIPYQIGDDCGVLVPAGDAAALVEAVNRLAAHPAERAAMGRAAQARVAAAFTWSHAAEVALDGYRQVLARHRATQG